MGPQLRLLTAALALGAALVAAPAAAWADDDPVPAADEGAAGDTAAGDSAAADDGSADDGAADDGAADDGGLAVIEDTTGEDLRVDIVGIRSIIGPEPIEALRTVPGSGFTLDRGRLEKSRAVTTIQGALRGQPGVTIRDEATAGTVPNIGFRGLNPDRSESVLILEDGVPVGFAPYTINAAYYIPPIERIARIEVLKGSGQILYGPHTVGAVMNLITPEIPAVEYARIVAMGGSHGYIAPYVEAGTTKGRWGFLFTGLLKQGDGYRDDTAFDMQDAMLKVRYAWSHRTDLTFKLTAHASDSQNTYLGLTQNMFDRDPRQNPVPNDTYDMAYYGGTATFRSTRANHEWLVNLYTSYGMRDWDRQDFARNTGFAAPPANTVATVGDTAIDGGAIYLRSSYGSRDRNFFKLGLEPRFRGKAWWGGKKHEYEVGARVHTEYYQNERNNRAMFTGPVTTRDRDINTTNAVALWVHDKAKVTRRLSISGGLRVEHYASERRFERQGNADVDFEGTTESTELIPGLGFTVDLGRNNTIFGGVHRGFAPPRTSDAIDSNGTDLDLDAEESWNYEVGVRGTPRPWLAYEATAFYMDFQNQVVPANESGGASTTNTNAGETEHFGVELGGSVNVLALASRRHRHASASKLWFDASWMFLNTENTTPGGIFEGNELPYAPENTGSFGLR